MLKYVCDRCGDTAIFKSDMPRRVKYWAMNNGKRISSFERCEVKETHLCKNCCRYVMDLFNPYDESEKVNESGLEENL